MSRGSMPSRLDVAEYWWSGAAREAEGFTLHCDLGEPECWGCGKFWTGDDGTEDAYNRASWLERCHLVPAARGGGEDVQNIVLLCRDCHEEMPNTTDRDYALRWVRERKWWLAAFTDEMAEAMRRIDPSVDQRVGALTLDEDEQLRNRYLKIRQEHCVNHFGQPINPATAAWAYVRALDEIRPVADLKVAA